jgi:hypothetical protein
VVIILKEKALYPMVVTEFGITKAEILFSANARSLIVVTVLGIVTEVIPFL